MENAAGLSDTEYQRVASRVLGIANKLRVLGVDSVLQVPTLVIAGDQSSGKSSVVEAIAGVALPRSDGTCTRCPTEVRMRTAALSNASEDAAWVCRIKLSRNYGNDGQLLLEKPPEELMCTVHDKSHIAVCVSAAQAVLLNPKAVESALGGAKAFVPDLSGAEPKDSEAMQRLGSAGGYELMFTANKVVLEIDGAEADLTIIDLPGIIHDHPGGKQYVDLVERMTRACLAPEHHIVAMALQAGLDPETQAIRLWVREADPSGHRSIGIITKPDTISEDSHIANGKLVRLVSGGPDVAAGSSTDSTHLRLGYYMVKNPTQEQLAEGITFAEARKAEEAYFATTKHWKQAVAASPRLASRLGARNLRAGLSALLIERIEAQLPDIRRAARDQLSAVTRELAAMPPPPGEDALQELRGLLWRAAEAMERHVHAKSSSDRTFYQQTVGLYRAYGERAIRSTPAFLVGRTLISALSSKDKGVAPKARASANSNGAQAGNAAKGAGADANDARRTQTPSGNGAGNGNTSSAGFTFGAGFRSVQAPDGSAASAAGTIFGSAGASAFGNSASAFSAANPSPAPAPTPSFGFGFPQPPASTPTNVFAPQPAFGGPSFTAPSPAPEPEPSATACALEEGEIDLTPFLFGSSATDADAARALATDERLQRELERSLFPQQHMTLEQVRSLRSAHLGRELPGFSPYSAVEELIRRFKGQWSRHALDCLEEVAAAAHEQGGGVVAELFGRYPKALRAVSGAFSEYVDELTSEASSQLQRLAEMEDADTFTLNDHYLRSQNATFLGRLKRAYLKAKPLSSTQQEEMQRVLQQLASFGLSFGSYEELFMAQTTDADDELQMMAACLAYFKVAFKRIQDAVPLHIRNALLSRLGDRNGLEEAILRCTGTLGGSAAAGSGAAAFHLHAEAAEVARSLMAEDEAVAARRVQRRDMERRLREAVALLHGHAA